MTESTKPMESIIEIVRDHSRRGEALILRRDGAVRAAAGILAAEGSFAVSRATRQLSQLATALERATQDEPPAPLHDAASA